MSTTSTADTTKCSPRGGMSRRAEPWVPESAGTQTASPLPLTAEESIEAWPTERTMVVAAKDQTAGLSTAADESGDELWVSEETDARWQERAPAVEHGFIAEVSLAPVVAVAVRVTAAPRVHRRVTAMATAAALGAVAIAGSLGLAGLVWPATPAESPSLAQSVRLVPDRNPTPAETRVSVTREASVFTPPPSLGDLTQRSAKPATPVVPSSPGASIAVAPVSKVREGQLRVTSTPSGARVTVNGIGWGQTPLTIEHLPPGMKTVRVTSAGYVSQQRLVDVRRDRPAATLHVTLTSEAGD